MQRWALYYIEAIVKRSPTITLRELNHALVRAGHPSYSHSALSKTLKRLGLTRKVTFRIAREQSMQKRAAFVREMGLYEPQQLVFIDESAVDWRNATRRWGRSPRGSKAYNRSLFHRGAHYSVLPACSLEKPIFALRVIEGSNNGHTLFDYLRQDLLPQCGDYPGPRSVIVMDNASTHHVEPVRRLIEMSGECAVGIEREPRTDGSRRCC